MHIDRKISDEGRGWAAGQYDRSWNLKFFTSLIYFPNIHTSHIKLFFFFYIACQAKVAFANKCIFQEGHGYYLHFSKRTVAML